MARKSSSNVLAGVGLAAAAAAAVAGAYFLYGGTEGAARRKKVKSWMLKMKGEVLERLEGLKEVNQDLYDKTVEAVAEQYTKVKDATPSEVARLVRELKSYWRPVLKELKK